MTVSTQDILPIIYTELKQLANFKMSQERSDHTLQPTALLNEVYIRLSSEGLNKLWDSPGHFYVAAAEAMRRILIDHARSCQSQKRGGDWKRVLFTDSVTTKIPPDELLALNEALDLFQGSFPRQAELVKLRYFGGMSHQEAADTLQISRATADRDWSFAKVWLFQQLQSASDTQQPQSDTEAVSGSNPRNDES